MRSEMVYFDLQKYEIETVGFGFQENGSKRLGLKQDYSRYQSWCEMVALLAKPPSAISPQIMNLRASGIS